MQGRLLTVPLKGNARHAQRLESMAAEVGNPLLKVASMLAVANPDLVRTDTATRRKRAVKGGSCAPRKRRQPKVVYRKDVPFKVGHHAASGTAGLARVRGDQVIIEADGVMAVFPAADVTFVDLPPVPITAYCTRKNDPDKHRASGRQAAQEEQRLVAPTSSFLAVRWMTAEADVTQGKPLDAMATLLEGVTGFTPIMSMPCKAEWAVNYLPDALQPPVPVTDTYSVPMQFFLAAEAGQEMCLVAIKNEDTIREVLTALHAAGFVAFCVQDPGSGGSDTTGKTLQRAQVDTLRPLNKSQAVVEARKCLATASLRTAAEEALKRVVAGMGKPWPAGLVVMQEEATLLERGARLLPMEVVLMPSGAANPNVKMWMQLATPVAIGLRRLCCGNSVRARALARQVYIDVLANYVEVLLLVEDYDASEVEDPEALTDSVFASFGVNGVTMDRMVHAELARRAFYHSHWGPTDLVMRKVSAQVLRSLAAYGICLWLINVYTASGKPAKRDVTTHWTTVAPWAPWAKTKAVAIGGGGAGGGAGAGAGAYTK